MPPQKGGISVLTGNEGHDTAMKQTTVISSGRHCHIEITHRSSDPGSWIVRRSRMFLWFKRRISSDWFIDDQQAVRFAEKMMQKHCGH
jgi:hypothetical protein